VLLDYKDYLEEKAGLSGETPYNYFARLKKILNDTYEHNIIPKNTCLWNQILKKIKR